MTSSCSIDLNLERAEMVILGTQYAGEMKKGARGGVGRGGSERRVEEGR
jgi:ATP-dependent phosphoenolpyruvate carboxykinase